MAANVSWRKQGLSPVKGGCCQVSLQAINRNNLVPGGQQHPSALEQHCLWRKALAGCEAWAFNLTSGRFYLSSGCTIWTVFSVSCLRQENWGKSHPEVLQQQGSFVAPRARTRTCCRDRQTVEVDQARHRVREEPCWTWLGEAGGTSSSFCPALHRLCPLPSRGAGLVAIYCPQHTTSTDKLCNACASSTNAVWKETTGRWSFSLEVWVSASSE